MPAEEDVYDTWSDVIEHPPECDGIICWDRECDCLTICPLCSEAIPPEDVEYLKSVGRWAVV